MKRLFGGKSNIEQIVLKTQPTEEGYEFWLESKKDQRLDLNLETLSSLEVQSLSPKTIEAIISCVQCVNRFHFSSESNELSQDVFDVFSKFEIETPLFSLNKNKLTLSYLCIAAARSGNLKEIANVDSETLFHLNIPEYTPLKAKVQSHLGIQNSNFALHLELMDLNGVPLSFKNRKGHTIENDDDDRLFISPFLNRVIDRYEAHILNRKSEAYKSDTQVRFSDLADIRQAALKAEIRLDPFIKSQNIVFIKALPYVIGRGPDEKVHLNPALPEEHAGLDRHFQAQLNSNIDTTRPDLINLVDDKNTRTRVVLSEAAWNDVLKIRNLQSEGQEALEKVIEDPAKFFGRKPRALIAHTFSTRVNGFIIGKLTSNRSDAGSGNDWSDGYEGNSTLLRSTDGSTVPILYYPMPVEYELIKVACQKLEDAISKEESEIRSESGAVLTPVPDLRDKKITVQGLGEFNLKELQTCCKRIEYANTVEIDPEDEPMARELIRQAEEKNQTVVSWGKDENGNESKIPLASLKNCISQNKTNSSEDRVSLSIIDQVSSVGTAPDWHYSTVDLAKFSNPPYFQKNYSLEDHQRKGFAWLVWLFEHSIYKTNHSHRGALLADDMGLGKTIQLLSFVAWLRSLPKNSKKPVLIVAPVSLIQSSWLEDGFQKFFEEQSVLGISSGSLGPIVRFSDCPIKIDRDLLLAEANRVNFDLNQESQKKLSDCEIDENLKSSLEQIGIWANNKIIITSYESLRVNSFTLGSIDFSVVILDEAQKIKNVGVLQSNAAKALKADMCIAMTGTPIENSLMDLWSIMDFVLPGHLGTNDEFKKKFVIPAKKVSANSSERLELKSNLEKALSPVWFRRTKSEVFRDSKSLPPIHHYDQYVDAKGNSTNLHLVEMPDSQFSIYETHLAYSKNSSSGSNRLQAIRSMIEACAAPWLATDEPLRWSNRNRIFELSPKLQKTIEILESIRARTDLEGRKVIIFANVIQIQQGLAFFIYEWNKATSHNPIEVEVYNGEANPKVRAEMLSRFKSNPGFQVLIISPKAGGAGLNIVEANNVIHYTREWNPALEKQATDRVYRMGQEREVHVYYPTTSLSKKSLISAEERLANILATKRDIMDDFTISASDHNFSEKEFEDILNNEEDRDFQIQADNLHLLDPYSFECLIACLYDRMGYQGHWCGKSGDGGADVLAIKGNSGMLIQVKHSQGNSLVGTGAIIQVRGAKTHYESKHKVSLKLVAATNFKFSEPTVHLAANGEPVQLIEYRQLKELLSKYPLRFSDLRSKKNEVRTK